MTKRNPEIEEKPQRLEEPVAAYGTDRSFVAPAAGISVRDRVLASTMSVDDYFDELIGQVRQDYANLFA